MMDISNISPTHSKQEVDILNRILAQSSYSEELDRVKLKLSQFEGKHFRHLSLKQLLERIDEVSTKFKNLKLINDFSVYKHEGVDRDLEIVFDIKDTIFQLEKHKIQIENGIAKTELQSKLKKNNYCWLDQDAKTFYFALPNGSPKPIPLWTERAQSNHTFLIFKVLYEHWQEFSTQIITKSTIKSQLSKLGWDDVSDQDLKNYIKNLRDTKIKPAQLSTYIDISYDRKLQGYRLVITYP